MSQPPLTYWDYLRLERLLSLQTGLAGDDAGLMPDELHFIVVHQVYELWFKLVLRELRLARDHLAAPRVPEEAVPHVVHHLRRINEILKLAVDQFRVMETLTPQDFLDFREKLTPASGFQSFQMREIEILLGLEETQRAAGSEMAPVEVIRQLAATSPAGEMAWGRIEAARRERTLRAALHEWLYRTPIQGSNPQDPGDDDAVSHFLEAYHRALVGLHDGQARRQVDLGGAASAVHARMQEAGATAHAFLFATDVPEAERGRARRIRAGLLFIESYRELPLLAWPRLLVDTVVEMEEMLVLWRTRHARMVERTIGRRMGTGGSSGVDYLDGTTRWRIFTELWAVRTLLLPRQALPELRNARAYGFVQ